MDLWNEHRIRWTASNFAEKAKSGYVCVQAVFTANQYFLREGPVRVKKIALTATAACLMHACTQSTLPKFEDDISDFEVRSIRQKYKEVSNGNSFVLEHAPFDPSHMDFASSVESAFNDAEIRKIYCAFVMGSLDHW